MRILVGIDGSAHAERALRWGLEEAQLHDATVTVVHAFDVHERSGVLERPATVAEQRAAADDLVARAVARSTGYGTVDIVVDAVGVIDDSAARVLLERARDNDLVVVGSRGLGGFRGLLLGSVSQQVSAHAPVPVAVVPSDRGDGDDAHDPQAVRDIVVGVDGSPHAERALCWALAEARVRHCPLTALYVYPPAAATLTSDVVAGLAQVLRTSFYAHSHAVAERLLGEAVARVAPASDVQIECRAVEGAAGAVLVDEAADPSTMLVLGSRGHGGFAGLLLGSVSQQCLHHARGPVVVVHQRAQP